MSDICDAHIEAGYEGEVEFWCELPLHHPGNHMATYEWFNESHIGCQRNPPHDSPMFAKLREVYDVIVIRQLQQMPLVSRSPEPTTSGSVVFEIAKETVPDP